MPRKWSFSEKRFLEKSYMHIDFWDTIEEASERI